MIGTRAGFVDDLEVVAVQFDASRLSFDDLIAHAERGECARRVFTDDPQRLDTARRLVGDRAGPTPGAFRPDAEPKYYLFKSALRSVPMTGLQAVRVNAAMRQGEPRALLSPRQQALLEEIERQPDARWPNLVGVDIVAGWRAIDALRTALAEQRARRDAAPTADRKRR